MRLAETLRIMRIATGLVVVSAVMVPLQVLALRFGWRVAKTLPVLWHRAVLRLTGIRVHVHGAPDRSPRGLLLAANHISWLDIVVLGSVTPLSFISKDEVRGWGMFGKLAQWQQTVFITRERRTDVAKQANAIAARLMQGDTLVLFPEGTTSDGNFIYPFNSSLFGALGLTGAGAETVHAVQPVAIAYTRLHGLPMGRYDRPLAAWPGDIELTPHLMKILRHGVIDVDVCFGEVIEAGPQTDRKALTAAVQRAVAQMAAAALRGRFPPSHSSKTGLLGHHDE